MPYKLCSLMHIHVGELISTVLLDRIARMRRTDAAVYLSPTYGVVCFCQCVCVRHTGELSCAKTAEPIEMPFGIVDSRVGRRNRVSDGSRSSTAKETCESIWGGCTAHCSPLQRPRRTSAFAAAKSDKTCKLNIRMATAKVDVRRRCGQLPNYFEQSCSVEII